MVWSVKSFCRKAAGTSGFLVPNSCLDFSMEKKDRTGIIPKVWMWWDTKSSSIWETWKSLGKASRQFVANLQSFFCFFCTFNSFNFGCWMQHVEPSWGEPKIIGFSCAQLQESLESAFPNSSRATQTPGPAFAPVPREEQSKLEQKIPFIPGL